MQYRCIGKNCRPDAIRRQKNRAAKGLPPHSKVEPAYPALIQPSTHVHLHARAKAQPTTSTDTDEWYLKNITVGVPKWRNILHFSHIPTAPWAHLRQRTSLLLFFFAPLRLLGFNCWFEKKMRGVAGRAPAWHGHRPFHEKNSSLSFLPQMLFSVWRVRHVHTTTQTKQP